MLAAEARLEEVALFRALPALAGSVPWVRLGHWPTPVEELPVGANVWVKREDRSSPVYGGNKVRTLEAVFGRAIAAGAERIWATGAYGSNHAVATVLHAPAAGLAGGLAMFPQPRSSPAIENLLAALSVRPALEVMSSPLVLPLVMRRLRRADAGNFVMAPGGATPDGTLGAMSAALELAEQVAAGVLPAPARIVLPVGSTCTTAGMLVGLCLARRLGIGFSRAPRVVAVRVTPWPITSVPMILALAARSARLIRELAGDVADIGVRELHSLLEVETHQFGGHYGLVTARGWRALHAFRRAGGPPLDIVYSAKAAAALLELVDRGEPGPLLFWATKSSAPLPVASPGDVARAPEVMRRWLRG